MDLVANAPSLPTPGETIMGTQLHHVPGGKGANQAVAAARLGSRVTMVGRVGDDEFGRLRRQRGEEQDDSVEGAQGELDVERDETSGNLHYGSEREIDLLGEALRMSGGVKKRAAQLLGVSFRSFRYRLEKLGLDRADGAVE